MFEEVNKNINKMMYLKAFLLIKEGHHCSSKRFIKELQFMNCKLCPIWCQALNREGVHREIDLWIKESFTEEELFEIML